MTLLAPPAPAELPPGPRPRFSVVVAAYQAEATLADAVASAFAQDEPPAEVVVCDDGSTDGTSAVLEDLRRQHGSRLVVLRRPNGGEARARNAAVRAAREDWVAVLDADDRFLPGRLRRLADAVQARPDLDLVTTDALRLVDGEVDRRVYGPSFPFPVEDQLGALLRRNLVLGMVAVRRAALLAVGGYPEDVAVATDWACWLRMLAAGARFGCLDEPLGVYRISPASLSGDRVRLLEGRLDVLERAAGLALGPEHRRVLASTRARVRSELLAERARRALERGLPGRRSLALAVAVDPRSGAGTRLKALASAVAPSAAARRLTAGAPRGTR